MAAVAAAAVVTAGMSFSMVMVAMMVAFDIGIIHQVACQKGLHCIIKLRW